MRTTALHRGLRILLVAVYALCFLVRAGQPPLADEIDFTAPIEKWVQSGPQERGLWHSPFYPWLLSLLARAFGFTVSVERAVGFLTTLAAAFLITAAAKRFRPKIEPWKVTLLLALSLLSPVTLGSALILDFDNTLLLAATALYGFVLVGWENRASPKTAVVFGLLLALCLMAKETTPLFYPAALFALLARRGKVTRAAAVSAASLLMGAAVSLMLTWLWCKAYNLPLAKVFEMDLLGLRIHGAERASRGFLHSAWVAFTPLLWIGIVPVAPMAALLARLRRTEPTVRAIAVLVVGVVAAYTLGLRQATYYFPKYMAPVLPWIPWLLLTREDRHEPSPSWRPRVFWAVAITGWVLVAPDPLAVLYHRDAYGMSVLLLTYSVPVVAWWALRRRITGAPGPRLFSVFVLLGVSLAYCKTALLTRRSVTYWYGETAVAEAVAAAQQWRAENPTGLMYSPAKDLAWALRPFGARYHSRDHLSAHARTICQDPRPLLVVTRIREDSSLTRAPELSGLRKCLRLRAGRDSVSGQKP